MDLLPDVYHFVLYSPITYIFIALYITLFLKRITDHYYLNSDDFPAPLPYTLPFTALWDMVLTILHSIQRLLFPFIPITPDSTPAQSPISQPSSLEECHDPSDLANEASPPLQDSEHWDDITPVPSRLGLSLDSSTYSILATPRLPHIIGVPASTSLGMIQDVNAPESDPSIAKGNEREDSVVDHELADHPEAIIFTTRPRSAPARGAPPTSTTPLLDATIRQVVDMMFKAQEQRDALPVGDPNTLAAIAWLTGILKELKQSLEELLAVVKECDAAREKYNTSLATLNEVMASRSARQQPTRDYANIPAPLPTIESSDEESRPPSPLEPSDSDSNEESTPPAIFEIPKWSAALNQSHSNLVGAEAELPLWGVGMVTRHKPETLVHFFAIGEIPRPTIILTPNELRFYPQLALIKMVETFVIDRYCPITDDIQFDEYEQFSAIPPSDISHKVLLTSAPTLNIARVYRTLDINRMHTREIWVLLIAALNTLATHHRQETNRADQAFYTALPCGVILPLDLILPSNMGVLRHQGDAFPGIDSPKQVVLEFKAHWMDRVIAEQSELFSIPPATEDDPRLSIHHVLFEPIRGRKELLLGWIPTPLIKGNKDKYHVATPHGFHPYLRSRSSSSSESIRSTCSRISGSGSGTPPGSPRKRRTSFGSPLKGGRSKEKDAKAGNRLSRDFDALSMTVMNDENDPFRGCEVARVSLRDGEVDDETLRDLDRAHAVIDAFEEDHRKRSLEMEHHESGGAA